MNHRVTIIWGSDNSMSSSKLVLALSFSLLAGEASTSPNSLKSKTRIRNARWLLQNHVIVKKYVIHFTLSIGKVFGRSWMGYAIGHCSERSRDSALSYFQVPSNWCVTKIVSDLFFFLKKNVLHFWTRESRELMLQKSWRGLDKWQIRDLGTILFSLATWTRTELSPLIRKKFT